ncbi:hypothetical protein KIL84_009567 [Mauremys mutica]|uniref:Uncharacterized protein n=1 Tax=Mauremys mutica TaxID=74926 RepID=A0A9D4B563_9SAUR|nr:hypothetical protein KIL84_009567 [Mauremys mutica]
MSCIPTAMVGTTTHTLVSLFHRLPRVGVMCQVLDLSTAEKGDDTPLQLECHRRLCYFSIAVAPPLIHVDEKWGAQCYLDMTCAARPPQSTSPSIPTCSISSLGVGPSPRVPQPAAGSAPRPCTTTPIPPSPGLTRSPARWATPSSRCPGSSTIGASPLSCPLGPEPSPSSSSSSSSPAGPSTVGEVSTWSRRTGMKPEKKMSQFR